MSLNVRIEIPRGSRVKYEINKETGEVEVDRIIDSTYPANYGFIENTLWEDGDALDAFIVGNFDLHPGVVAKNVKPIALIEMWDNGVSDFKIVCIIDDQVWSNSIFSIEVFAVENFLATYKKGVEIGAIIFDENAINEVIMEGYAAFLERKNE